MAGGYLGGDVGVEQLGPVALVRGAALVQLMSDAALGAKVRARNDGVSVSDMVRLRIRALADAADEAGLLPESMSRSRHGDVANEVTSAQLDSMVGGCSTQEAAMLLGLSQRQVQRTAASLGGRTVGRVLVLDRGVVAAEAARRRAAVPDQESS